MKGDFSHHNTVDFGEQKTGLLSPKSVRLFPLFAWVVAGAFFLVTAISAGVVSRGENIADAAEKLLGAIHETHYQHRTYIVESAGIYDMDCSGFVDFLLKRVAPEQYVCLPIEPGHARPRAAMYFELLSGLPGNRVPGWNPIDRLADAQRGDIVVSPGQYRVVVYDSSGIHHDHDSRPEATSGIGKGAITFRADDRGIPVGFQFNSHAHFHLEPIAIGRLTN
jgi:hypothetical protein